MRLLLLAALLPLTTFAQSGASSSKATPQDPHAHHAASAHSPEAAARHHAGHAAHAHHDEPADTTPKARAQLRELAREIERYRDVDAARRDGWRPSPVGKEDTPLMGEHWSREGQPELMPGQPLDFARPTNLQYARVGGRYELVGVSFVVRLAAGDPLPDGFDGNADHWHVHDAQKAFDAMTEERPILRRLGVWWIDANYRSKGDRRHRLAMVHAWVTLPSPDGLFAMHNVAIPYLRAGLPAAWAVAGDEDAAQGVNLAIATGCRAALDARLWIAHATSTQSRTLHASCEHAASRVRKAIAQRRDAAHVNAAARSAWLGLETRTRELLDAHQLRRIAALTEHEPGAH